MKPVPITPITGTTLPVFPLDRVRTRFHIMENIPGYRNHFFRERRIAPIPGARVEDKTRDEMPKSNRPTIDATMIPFLRPHSGTNESVSTFTAFRNDLA
jgi:hypothetical protein